MTPGAEACKEGKGIIDNPHPYLSLEWKAWKFEWEEEHEKIMEAKLPPEIQHILPEFKVLKKRVKELEDWKEKVRS